jgi:hypothetical protein
MHLRSTLRGADFLLGQLTVQILHTAKSLDFNSHQLRADSMGQHYRLSQNLAILPTFQQLINSTHMNNLVLQDLRLRYDKSDLLELDKGNNVK